MITGYFMNSDCSNVINNTADLCISVRTPPPSALIVSPMIDTTFCMKLFGR
jgi:hypothetical protein